uniref:RNA polymerase sigma factor n=1 Tax=Altererythrobacter segetis TaxID=1104773 RepID=UPI001FAF33F2|nr:sigma-70 family RNA polymerase sigma factor [Altererythrobacter segetis]
MSEEPIRISDKASAARGANAAELLLLEKIRRGDRSAFEALYRAYHPRLTRFLLRLVRRPQLVEEALNDTLMVVWQRPDSFHGGSKLSTWIFAIAYRKAMKALGRFDDPREDPEGFERADEGPGPEENSAGVLRRDLLARAMDELSPAHRAVVDLTYYHELDYNEIARILDCPVGTVKTRMFHARRQLRRIVGGGLEDWV